MSYPQPNSYTLKADAAISQGMAVKIGSDKFHVAKSALATQKHIGLALCAATTAEDAVEVAMPGGGGLALLGGTVVAGDLLTSDTAGKLVATTTGNDKIIAQALEGGDADQLIAVNVVVGNF